MYTLINIVIRRHTICIANMHITNNIVLYINMYYSTYSTYICIYIQLFVLIIKVCACDKIKALFLISFLY